VSVLKSRTAQTIKNGENPNTRSSYQTNTITGELVRLLIKALAFAEEIYKTNDIP
jgi:hypothetical protein